MPAWLDLKEGSKTLTASFQFNLATLHSGDVYCVRAQYTYRVPQNIPTFHPMQA